MKKLSQLLQLGHRLDDITQDGASPEIYPPHKDKMT